MIPTAKTGPLRRRPPEQALRWAAGAVGPGSRVTHLRRFATGGWHANHALTIRDRHGGDHLLVLRRWARPEWITEDPDFTATREASALALLAPTPVPAPRLVAADPEASFCDAPALLLTRLPGRAPGLPPDLGRFLVELAGALPPVHAVEPRGSSRVPDYRPYSDLRAAAPPSWSRHPELWTRALAAALADPPPGPRCFIHRDYHPENTLLWRGRLTGIVDWTQASWGPPAVDTGHMRWNLALTYGLDAADEFLRAHQALAGPLPGQRHWDLVTVLDVLVDLDPADWSAFELARLERYVARVLEG